MTARPFRQKAIAFLKWREHEHGIPWRRETIGRAARPYGEGRAWAESVSVDSMPNHIIAGAPTELDVAFDFSARTGRILR